MERAGVQFRGAWVEAAPEGHFNRMMQATRNKGTVLFTQTVRLIQRITESLGNRPLRIWGDRQGGRICYRQAPMTAYEDVPLEVIDELPEHSGYTLRRPGAPFVCGWVTRGESKNSPIALASVYSKYVRELFMISFNRYWTRHLANPSRRPATTKTAMLPRRHRRRHRPPAGGPQLARPHGVTVSWAMNRIGRGDAKTQRRREVEFLRPARALMWSVHLLLAATVLNRTVFSAKQGSFKAPLISSPAPLCSRVSASYSACGGTDATPRSLRRVMVFRIRTQMPYDAGGASCQCSGTFIRDHTMRCVARGRLLLSIGKIVATCIVASPLHEAALPRAEHFAAGGPADVEFQRVRSVERLADRRAHSGRAIRRRQCFVSERRRLIPC